MSDINRLQGAKMQLPVGIRALWEVLEWWADCAVLRGKIPVTEQNPVEKDTRTVEKGRLRKRKWRRMKWSIILSGNDRDLTCEDQQYSRSLAEEVLSRIAATIRWKRVR